MGQKCCKEEEPPELAEVVHHDLRTEPPEPEPQPLAPRHQPKKLSSFSRRARRDAVDPPDVGPDDAPHYAAEGEGAEGATSVKSAALGAMQRLEVDQELLRGISLKKSLRGGGSLWLRSPLDLSEAKRSTLWDKSVQVENIDVFLSHTWLTPGRWKVLSLMLQSGWPCMLLGWAMAVVLMLLLCGLDALPATSTIEVQVLDFQGTCPLGPWILIGGLIGSVLGLFLSPYLPNLLGAEMCFLDVVSIHQTNHELMERGIYGLGGFLSVSKQLRVLWSPPYLTRLWCVFELAAYRKANPSGTIVLAPLFIEMAIGCVLLGTYAVVFVFWISQSMNVNLPLTYTGYVLSLVPAYVAFHVLRTSTREKLKLITDLKAFDLEGADCRSDYDRDFIFAGITAWYGSKTAFADYVRGPLFDELVRPLSKNQVPNVYWCLLLTPTIGSGLEFLLAIWKGGGPSAVLLSHFIGVVVGMQTLWMLVSLKLGFYLCDRFASLGRVDFTKTLMIFLVFTVCVVFGTALATQAYVESQYLAMVFACGAGLLVFLSFGGWRCIRSLSRSTTKNLAL